MNNNESQILYTNVNRFVILSSQLTEYFSFDRTYSKLLKGIVQPFEMGGMTRLICSAVKFWKAGNLKKKILMIETHERSLNQTSAA
jgi:hypothetical protein